MKLLISFHYEDVNDVFPGRQPDLTGRILITVVALDPRSRACWYDFSVSEAGSPNFKKRYAGHVETGHDSMSDPEIG